MSKNLQVLDEQKEALRQVKLILPQLSKELVDIIVIVEEQLFPAVNQLEGICSTEATQRLKAEIQEGLGGAIGKIAASSGSIDCIQEAVDDLETQLVSLTLITEEEEDV